MEKDYETLRFLLSFVTIIYIFENLQRRASQSFLIKKKVKDGTKRKGKEEQWTMVLICFLNLVRLPLFKCHNKENFKQPLSSSKDNLLSPSFSIFFPYSKTKTNKTPRHEKQNVLLFSLNCLYSFRKIQGETQLKISSDNILAQLRKLTLFVLVLFVVVVFF